MHNVYMLKLLLERVVVDSERAPPLFEEQLWVLVGTDDDAADRAETIKCEESIHYKNLFDQTVTWRIVKVEGPLLVGQADKLEHGVEVYSRFLSSAKDALEIHD